MATEEYMHLQHSESVVAQMAATIFAGLIQKFDLDPLNEDVLVDRAMSIAIKLAVRAEKRVKSDEEWARKETGSAFLGG